MCQVSHLESQNVEPEVSTVDSPNTLHCGIWDFAFTYSCRVKIEAVQDCTGCARIGNMATSKPAPLLPAGNAGILTGIGENFGFHASPEVFLSSRILQYQLSNPHVVEGRHAVRAKILNRNVIIVSAYDQIKQVLAPQHDSETPYVAAAPYKQLMESFFPPPNLLLVDGCPHRDMRESWDRCAEHLVGEEIVSTLTRIAEQYAQELSKAPSFDVYARLKDLAWQLFLRVFLDIGPGDESYPQYVSLQEDLLRGQFSLMPISINTGFWQSPRSLGIASRKKLQSMISVMLAKRRPAWLAATAQPDDELVNHVLMATSSLAVKAFASLALALLLNVLVDRGQGSILERLPLDDGVSHSISYQAILDETLRVSPPIVGVMRRATKQQILRSVDEREPDVLIPQGWDIWTYFPGSNRDKSVYGADADLFKAERYRPGHDHPPPPIAFGTGSKTCLGQAFTRTAAIAVLKAFQRYRLDLETQTLPAGVRGWLGWSVASPEEWARDVKQLPTQRPSRAILASLKSPTARA